jgi:hypothetical protein
MIDFYQVQADLKTILVAGTYTDVIKEWFIEAMERDLLLGNFPCVCINLPKANLNLISIPNGYYGTLQFRIMVVAMDFTEFRKAAIVRDRILKEVQLRLQANRAFSAIIATSTIGPSVDFAAGIAAINNEMKGHVASAEFDFFAEVSVDATP